ncbi:hypothetical protein [Bradyrhizobium retamae]|uniref:Uncharacterized protein n=1 Tax=Bradyrhizobium retamae TaxID=1300035 RepID=A0A0R3MKV5_9BRAD|nr:hypothetical protein [Bradyrhizobium retamae]KRR18799.1 hypothetical protein CQ13_10185 [Bradyrhizobium retamae]
MLEIALALVKVMAAAAVILLPISWILGKVLTTEPPSLPEWVRVFWPTDVRSASKEATAIASPASNFLLSPTMRSVAVYGAKLVSMAGALYWSVWLVLLALVALAR